MHAMDLMETATRANAPRLRRRVIGTLRSWGVPLDDDTAFIVGVVVSNTFGAALQPPRWQGQLASVRLVLAGRALTVEVLTGTSAFPALRTPSAGRLPEILAIHTTDTGIEQRLRGTRVWATTLLPAGAPRRRARHRFPRLRRRWARAFS
ncbi:hypothetical protein ACFVFS_34645 [Kitasatospora sp. NPDC057692]|uniref:hypothetical protein n=1 Tax=Kitasatospora sp. NPDC057692 TaxID=3346215 RepID=UPI0036ACD688